MCSAIATPITTAMASIASGSSASMHQNFQCIVAIGYATRLAMTKTIQFELNTVNM